MYAVVMAGGKGSRLRPLTCNLPKPMVKLCGKPILQYILELLERHDIFSVGITVKYLSNVITDYFENNQFKNIDISFFQEDFPLGTAGSVKNATKDIDDDFVVISGDAITDFDISAAVKFHKNRNADVTIVVKSVDDPREYGLVNVDENNNVIGFIEKPGYSQVNNDIANTGIYIVNPRVLDLIPDAMEFDFSKDLFPLMLKKKMNLIAYKDNGYWCDIGDLNSYLNCQKDILNKKVKHNIIASYDKDGNIFKDKKPYGIYILNPPVYIGENVKIEDGSIIEKGTVIEDNCVIGKDVKLSGCNIQDRSLIDDRSSLVNSIVCSGVSIKKDVNLFEGSTIGFNTVIGNDATVYPNIKIWPQKFIEDGIIVTDNIKYSSVKKGFIEEEGIIGEVGVELTPEFSAKVGAALGSIAQDSIVAVGSDSSSSSITLKQALIAGIQSTGSQAWNFGNNFESMFAYGMTSCDLKLGIFISGDENSVMKLYSEGALPAKRNVERALELTLSNGEYNRCKWMNFSDDVDMSGHQAMYKKTIESQIQFSLKGLKCVVKSKNKMIEDIMNKILKNIGVEISDDIIVHINESGTNLFIESNNIKDRLSYWRVLTICCLGEFEKGYSVSIPIDAPQIIDKIADGYNLNVYRYLKCPADNSDNKARKIACNQIWVRDALMLTLKFLSFIKVSGKSLKQINDLIPEFETTVKTIKCEENPASILNEFSKVHNIVDNKLLEGILVNYNNGYALIRPLKRGNGFSVLAESSRMETANEICEHVNDIIKQSKERLKKNSFK